MGGSTAGDSASASCGAAASGKLTELKKTASPFAVTCAGWPATSSAKPSATASAAVSQVAASSSVWSSSAVLPVLAW